MVKLAPCVAINSQIVQETCALTVMNQSKLHTQFYPCRLAHCWHRPNWLSLFAQNADFERTWKFKHRKIIHLNKNILSVYGYIPTDDWYVNWSKHKAFIHLVILPNGVPAGRTSFSDQGLPSGHSTFSFSGSLKQKKSYILHLIKKAYPESLSEMRLGCILRFFVLFTYK